MAIKPHPSKEKTWIIDFAQMEGGRIKYHPVEFAGSLKKALEHQIFLRKSINNVKSDSSFAE